MLHYGLYLSVCQKLGVLSKWLNGSGGFWHRERKCAENYNKHNKFIFFKPISILLISNQNSFRVLFDKTASVYLIWKIYILPLEMASSGNQHCANYIGNFVPYGGFLPPILHCVIRKYVQALGSWAGSAFRPDQRHEWHLPQRCSCNYRWADPSSIRYGHTDLKINIQPREPI